MWWTLGSAAVGALTAILIAFVAYPWQKRKDRHQQLKSEKREAYRRFVEEANGYFARCALGGKIDKKASHHEHYIRVVAVSSDLIVYAPREVIEACQRYTQCLFEYSDLMGSLLSLPGCKEIDGSNRKELYQKVKLARRAAMISIRIDLNEHDEEEANLAVRAFFVLTPDHDDLI